MARRKNYTTNNAYRALERIQLKAEDRAEEIAQEIVEAIRIRAPEDPEHEKNTGGPKLKDSYYVRQDPDTGDLIIASRRRYWAYVEFGTRRRQFQDMQPHVRPALDTVRALHS